MKTSAANDMARMASGWSGGRFNLHSAKPNAEGRQCPLRFSMSSRRRLGWALFVRGSR